MTTQPKQVDKQRQPFIWNRRATYTAAKTKRQRERQFRNQLSFLYVTLLVSVVAGLVFVYLNWLQAGSTKTVSCDEYSHYCLPLAGGGSLDPYTTQIETSETRELDEESEGSPDVVRGITDDYNMPFLGDPNAPIHFVTISDFACSHCQDFHRNDLRQFIKDYVLTGKATLQFGLTTGTGRSFSETASQAALCAGEQGAFWEMADELFRLGSSMSVTSAFDLKQIRESAENMGLDAGELERCITSGTYRNVLENYRLMALDNGVTGTPTVLVSYGNDGQWTVVNRGYSTLSQYTERVWENLEQNAQDEATETPAE